jgi:hypothetical protein
MGIPAREATKASYHVSHLMECPGGSMLSKKKVALLDPDEIKDLDIMMREAITLKFIAAALTGDQLKELIQIPPRR